MIHFNKILCPFDLSDHAEESIRYAIKLADLDTEIVLLNVIQLPYIIDPNGFTYYDLKVDELRKDFEKAMLEKEEALKSKFPNNKFSHTIEVGSNPADVVLNYQKSGNFDLIVIGSHGRKGLSRLLMGSVAESIMRDADCPVLIIKSK